MTVKKTAEIGSADQIVDIRQAQSIRILAIFLVLRAVVSYRSVPRILKIFTAAGYYPSGWTPHFTSVINWTLRLGLGLLKKVKPIEEPWIAIIDHSIDIGTKKVLVVLRITTDALMNNKRAICLENCECVGLRVSEKIDGKSISEELTSIFNQAGSPVAVLKDCDRTLQKGVKLWSDQQSNVISVIEDLGHILASALKAQFCKSEGYMLFTATASAGAKKLRQTNLAFLTPPKLRTKGRFQSIGKLAEWAAKMLSVLQNRNVTFQDDTVERLNSAFPDLIQSSQFIEDFANTARVMSQVMGILKNQGLDSTTCDRCQKLSEQLPKKSKVRQRLSLWLQQHIAIQEQITTHPLLISSDIIESLFGNFKHILERSPQADMNRTTLLIPALCGTLNEASITQAMNLANHSDLKTWERENIPYTMRKKRQCFLGNTKAK
jgi:hypothetical protein